MKKNAIETEEISSSENTKVHIMLLEIYRLIKYVFCSSLLIARLFGSFAILLNFKMIN